MKFINFLLLAALLFAFGCQKKPTEPEIPKTSKVSGKVILEGHPLQDAVVKIGEIKNLQISTNENGEFSFNEVIRGEHSFSVRKDLPDGKTIEHEVKILVIEQVHDLGEIKVVNPVAINQPVEVDGTYINLTWNKSESENFAEYRVYRKTSGGVSHKDGELIFSSTSINDISFNDYSYRSGVNNHYKVYVYANNGSLSGSNTGNIQIPEVNLLPNGDFETSSDGTLPDQWILRLGGEPEFKYFQVTGESVQSGSQSIKITYDAAGDHPDSVWGSWGGLGHTLSTFNWVVGKDYTLSFWVNSQIGNFMVRVVKNGDMGDPFLSYTVVNEGGWKEKKINFQIDSETNYIEVWVSTRPGQAKDGIVKGFIDNMKLIK